MSNFHDRFIKNGEEIDWNNFSYIQNVMFVISILQCSGQRYFFFKIAKNLLIKTIFKKKDQSSFMDLI